MDSHENARLTPKGREAMVRAVVDKGLTKAAAARRFNTSTKTVAKWVERFGQEGVQGLRDRSSRPHSSPNQTSQAACTAIEALRRQRFTGEQIAVDLASDGEPHPSAAGPQSAQSAGTSRAGAALRARAARRIDPHRHQKAR
jgi:transposase-like protein